MPYCPRCGWEYEPGQAQCLDCGSALVGLESRSASSMPRHEEPLVRIAEVANEALASMWSEMLANHGIPCLAKATGVGVGGFASAAPLTHHLYVRAADEARAIQLLSELAGDDPSVGVKRLPGGDD